MTFKNNLAALLAGAAFSVLASTAALAATTERVPADTFAGAYLAGGAAMTDFDFDIAADYYGDALRFAPDNADVERQYLIALVSAGRFDEALPVAEKLKTIPDIERVSRVALGLDAIRQGKYLEAQSLLILSSDNELERLLTGIMRAWAQAGNGNAQTAIATVEGLEGPDWYILFKTYHAALIAQAAGLADTDQRFTDGMNDAAGGSASPLTYLRMAEVQARRLAAAGEFDRAKTVVEQGLAIAPNNPTMLRLADSIEKGETLTPKMIDPVSGAAEILLNLGSAINREGSEAFAMIYLQMARAMVPDEAQTLYELGSIADRLQRPLDAITYYGAIAPESELHRAAALQQGLALADLDRNDEARQTLADLVEESPDDYGGYLALGSVLAVQKDFAEAAKVYETALENIDANDARYWPLHYRQGIAYERTKQWPKAEAAFKKALELSPNQPDVLNYLGYSWIDMNINLEEGLEMIRTAVEMRPRDGYIVDSLGWAYYRLGQFEEAVVELERASDLRAQDPTINDHLGDAYWRVGRKLEAVYQWSQSLDMEPEEDQIPLIKAKLDAANSGQQPLIAESRVDDPAKGKVAGEDKAEPAPAPQPEPEKPADGDRTDAGDAMPKVEKAAYVVQPGDSLWTIANEELGDGEKMGEILDANPVLKGNPDRIFPGMELILP